MALAIVLAACEATTPSGLPPTDRPVSTPASTPAGGPTPGPSGCSGSLTSANATEARVEFDGPRSRKQGNLMVESITRLLDGARLYEDTTDSGAHDADFVIGGEQLALSFELDPGPTPGQELTEILALFRPPGDGSWTPLAVASGGSGRSVTIPDGSGPGQLRLTATWTDGCFIYAGTVRFAFEVVPAATVEACPPDVAGLSAILRAHDDDQIVIDGISRSIGTISFAARYVLYDAADQVGPFGWWDPAAAGVDASVGELLAVSDDDPDLGLTGGYAEFYRRSDVESRPDGNVAISAMELVADVDGRLSIVSPAEAGSYVLQLSTSWELECLTGGGLIYFSVDVGSPVGGLPRASAWIEA